MTVAAGQTQDVAEVGDVEHAFRGPQSASARPARKINDAPRTVNHPLAQGRFQSPLRYPGAKSGLANVIGELIEAASASREVRKVELFVEPFAGGASTSLRLVGAGVVERALLADADPMVAAFWRVAAARTTNLIERISDEHATFVEPGGSVALDRWDYWRAWEPKPGMTPATVELEQATKCMFLNRTTFSGILHGNAGPIGGRAQTSEYTIGCRFNLPALTERLEYVGHLYDAGRIVDVWTCDWEETLAGVASQYKILIPNHVVAYLDPPYLTKSGKLYRRSFDVEANMLGSDLEWTAGLQHLALARYLRTEMRYRWILSYDFDPALLNESAYYAAAQMHPDAEARKFDGAKRWRISKRSVQLNYTASSRKGRGRAQELLLTTLPPSTVPVNERLGLVDDLSAEGLPMVSSSQS